jgi:hypothetical protein
MEHFTDPEVTSNTLAIPFPCTEADADCWLRIKIASRNRWVWLSSAIAAK